MIMIRCLGLGGGTSTSAIRTRGIRVALLFCHLGSSISSALEQKGQPSAPAAVLATNGKQHQSQSNILSTSTRTKETIPISASTTTPSSTRDNSFTTMTRTQLGEAPEPEAANLTASHVVALPLLSENHVEVALPAEPRDGEAAKRTRDSWTWNVDPAEASRFRMLQEDATGNNATNATTIAPTTTLAPVPVVRVSEEDADDTLWIAVVILLVAFFIIILIVAFMCHRKALDRMEQAQYRADGRAYMDHASEAHHFRDVYDTHALGYAPAASLQGSQMVMASQAGWSYNAAVYAMSDTTRVRKGLSEGPPRMKGGSQPKSLFGNKTALTMGKGPRKAGAAPGEDAVPTAKGKGKGMKKGKGKGGKFLRK
ncbi:unnamed protein product [Amoebophrya sp. A25]|nr:unnamed protein product [Amoebophrya sp. A25]|eukprot:GSA25T00023820001.1